MDKRWILLVAVAIFDVTSAGWNKSWQKFKPPHHWHDCGSSEKDWDNLPDQGGKDWNDFDKRDDWNNGGWVYPDQKPRPPWPRPKPQPKPTPTPQPTSTPPIVTTRSPEVIQACMRTCAVTSQYNPVCGSDGVTYSNIGRLECARFCGVDVQLSRATACSTDNGSSSSTSTSTTTTARPDVQACVSRCPVTPEYNPVCGSDGVTYANPGRLECARICGVNVQLSRNTRCPTNQPVTPTPAPVITTPSNNGGTTISKDILDLIFTTTESDGSGLLDERHQDE